MLMVVFKDLKPLQISEFLILGLSVALLPYSWVLTIYAMCLLAINTLARIAVERKVGNPMLSKWGVWCMWLMIAFFLYHIVSLLYTENMEVARELIIRRLPLIVFPLCCLAVDMSYLSRNRVRMLMWLFTAALVVKFFVRLVFVIATCHKLVLSSTFDPVHHTYMAMYLMFAMGFLYSEWFTHRGEMSKALLVSTYVSMLVVAAYIFFVMSRTGVLGLALMFLAVVAHQLFVVKNIKFGLLVFVAGLLLGGSVFLLLPDGNRRVTNTLEELSEGNTSDARYYIMGSSVKAIKENMPLGVGIGDGRDVLGKVYEDSGEEFAIKAQYNSHNIYLDVLLTLGIPGLLLLLSLLTVSVVYALRQRDIVLLSLLFALAFSGLFEAVLNRQMGLLFAGMFWMILIPSRS